MSSAPRTTSTIRRWPACCGRRPAGATGRRHRRGDAGRDAHRGGLVRALANRMGQHHRRVDSRSGARTGRCFRPPPTWPAVVTTCTKPRTASGWRSALSNRSSGMGSASGSSGRISIPLQHAPEPERTRVVNALRAVFRTRTRAEWLERFAGDDVCLTTVYEPEEVYHDPHVAAAAGRRAPHIGRSGARRRYRRRARGSGHCGGPARVASRRRRHLTGVGYRIRPRIPTPGRIRYPTPSPGRTVGRQPGLLPDASTAGIGTRNAPSVS